MTTAAGAEDGGNLDDGFENRISTDKLFALIGNMPPDESVLFARFENKYLLECGPSELNKVLYTYMKQMYQIARVLHRDGHYASNNPGCGRFLLSIVRGSDGLAKTLGVEQKTSKRVYYEFPSEHEDRPQHLTLGNESSLVKYINMIESGEMPS